jgi:hypothetical protein
MVKFVPDTVAWRMVTFEPPGLVRATACVWLVPTETLVKITEEGLTVSEPLPAKAGEVRRKITKKKNERDSNGRRFHFEPKFFTARPRKPC